MTNVKVLEHGRFVGKNFKQSELPIMVKYTIPISLCKAMFDSRFPNREIAKNTVVKYKREMMLGNWRAGASVLHFDKHGHNLDGQHRLAAAIEANIPLKTMIAFGSTIEDMMVVDTGKERKAKDRKKIRGLSISESCMVTLRLACSMKGSLSQMPATVEDALYERYGDVAEFVCSRTEKKGPKGQTGMKLALIKAYYHMDEEVIERFIEVINSGLPDSLLNLKERDPAFRLREWLYQKTGSEVLRRREVFAKSLNAIKLFEKGQGISFLRSINNTDIFPLPEEDVYIPAPEKLQKIA